MQVPGLSDLGDLASASQCCAASDNTHCRLLTDDTTHVSSSSSLAMSEVPSVASGVAVHKQEMAEIHLPPGVEHQDSPVRDSAAPPPGPISAGGTEMSLGRVQDKLLFFFIISLAGSDIFDVEDSGGGDTISVTDYGRGDTDTPPPQYKLPPIQPAGSFTEEIIFDCIETYSKTSQMPELIVEASMYDKTFFSDRLLPALLTISLKNDVLEAARVQIIELLYKKEQVPIHLYDSFMSGDLEVSF